MLEFRTLGDCFSGSLSAKQLSIRWKFGTIKKSKALKFLAKYSRIKRIIDMKRWVIIACALMFSNLCFAATLNSRINSRDVYLCAPQQSCGFSFGLTGGWNRGQASGAVLNSFVFGKSDLLNDTVSSKVARFDFDHEWIWGANFGYHLPCSASSLQLDYFHLQDNDHQFYTVKDNYDSVTSFWVPSLSLPVGSITDVDQLNPIIILDYKIPASLQVKLDQADIKLARLYQSSCSGFQIQPAFGVRYGKLNTSSHADFASRLYDDIAPVSPLVNLLININDRSKFNGIGPLVSLDARYSVCGCLGLFGHVDSSILLGTVSSELATDLAGSALAGDNSVISTFAQSKVWQVNSSERLVTTVSGRVGLDYYYSFWNCTVLTVEVGYQVAHYCNAIQLLRGELQLPADLTPEVADTATRILDNPTASFTFNGPYLNVTYRI